MELSLGHPLPRIVLNSLVTCSELRKHRIARSKLNKYRRKVGCLVWIDERFQDATTSHIFQRLVRFTQSILLLSQPTP